MTLEGAFICGALWGVVLTCFLSALAGDRW